MTTAEDAARLAEIQERLAKATPGPWDLTESAAMDRCHWIITAGAMEITPRACAAGDYSNDHVGLQADDLDLIANAPADLAFLLAELAKAQQEVDSVRVSRDLLQSLTDDDPCWFDHHGGCQAHGYLSLLPTETCPQAEAKAILARPPVSGTGE